MWGENNKNDIDFQNKKFQKSNNNRNHQIQNSVRHKHEPHFGQFFIRKNCPIQKPDQ